MSNRPFITVLMPAYNAGRFVANSIDSILAQTRQDFELLIIDDGSTDATTTIITRYMRLDPRIRLITHKRNRGITSSLNEGLKKARGEYIVRMDADDISLPDRIAEQVNFLALHPEVAVCGSWLEYINQQGVTIKTNAYFSDPKLIAFHGLFFNPVAHPSVCFRKSVIMGLGAYRNKKYVEDFDLWSRVLRISSIAIIPQVLLAYRINPDSISVTNKRGQEKAACTLVHQNLSRYGSFSLHDAALLRHKSVFRFWVLLRLLIAYALGNKLSLLQTGKLLFSLRIYLF